MKKIILSCLAMSLLSLPAFAQEAWIEELSKTALAKGKVQQMKSRCPTDIMGLTNANEDFLTVAQLGAYTENGATFFNVSFRNENDIIIFTRSAPNDSGKAEFRFFRLTRDGKFISHAYARTKEGCHPVNRAEAEADFQKTVGFWRNNWSEIIRKSY